MISCECACSWKGGGGGVTSLPLDTQVGVVLGFCVGSDFDERQCGVGLFPAHPAAVSLFQAANGGSGNHAAEIAAYRRQLLLAVQGKLSAEVTAALQKVLDEGGDTAAGSPEASSPSGEVMM